jgi:hypothetical protein
VPSECVKHGYLRVDVPNAWEGRRRSAPKGRARHIPSDWLVAPSHPVSVHALILFKSLFGCLYT